jgi:PAS domain S-box-containing protein
LNSELPFSYRQLVNSIEHFGLALLSHAGEVIAWSYGAEKLLGYTETEAMGMSFPSLIAGNAEAFRGEKLLAEAGACDRVERGIFLRTRSGKPVHHFVVLSKVDYKNSSSFFSLIVRKER